MKRNRIVLGDISGMDVEAIVALSAEELATPADEKREKAKALKDRLDGAIDRK